MGGMLSAVMASKYPDVFAAAMAGQGIYDLIAQMGGQSNEEMGGPYSEATRFEWTLPEMS